ncbi:unnamed protein product [Caenorhabditis angaria]|uniref:Uncharacterized protein n=1 Tax=Caenorhabditis angaria TaxID=860376 RepID=A0A9P1I3B2_9PELO|nr:unnamed protein product [Caenorhabditis angaria]
MENVEIAGNVDLKQPETEYYLVEEYENAEDEQPKMVYFSRLIGEGRADLKTKYNLRDRCYIGNTTMDPELSFIQANISQIRPAELVLDPFVG